MMLTSTCVDDAQHVPAEHSLEATTGKKKTLDGGVPIQHGELDVYFDELADSRYVPRAVLVDLDRTSLDSIRGSPHGAVFRPENFVAGQYGTGNCFATGFGEQGTEVIGSIMDSVRKLMEGCESTQGFKLLHSLGGGCGSGLGSLILQNLSQEFSTKIFATVSVLPSLSNPESVVEPYNFVLAMMHQVELAHATICMDNDALFRFSGPNATYQTANEAAARALCDTTASMRFACPLNDTLRKLCMNLVPFPRLHFFTLSSAQATIGEDVAKDAQELVQQLLHSRSHLASCDLQQSRLVAVAASFRGEQVPAFDIESAVSDFCNTQSASFLDFIPDCFKCSFASSATGSDSTEAKNAVSSSLLTNSGSIQSVFNRLLDAFTQMFRRKAFLRPYCAYGGMMDEMEFTEAESNLNDLISEFQGLVVPWGASVSDDEFEEEGEEQETEVG